MGVRNGTSDYWSSEVVRGVLPRRKACCAGLIADRLDDLVRTFSFGSPNVTHFEPTPSPPGRGLC